MSTKHRVPVGATPIPRFATWGEHREALRLEALRRRETFGRKK